jgi:tetratricopeptide (TPR) repeat protein
MTIKSFFYITVGFGLAAASVFADTTEQQTLYSPITGQLFSKLGNDLLGVRSNEVDVAMTFLQAGILLDEQSAGGYEQFLRGAGKSCGSRQNYSDTILLSLRRYLDRKADLEVVAESLGCVLDNANSRQERELLLGRLLSQMAEANPVFGSDIASQLGLYAVEKADYAEATRRFEQACQMNPYNLLAGSKLLELHSQQTPAAAMDEKLVYLRLRLATNPADLQAIVEFGKAAYRARLYEPAADAFGYAAALCAWLRPDASPSDEIVVGWAESCYFVPSRRSQCMAIADQVRKAGRYNLAVESVAVLAVQKLAKESSKEKTFDVVASEAEQLLLTGSRDVTPMQIGWFYCFVLENPEKAMAWCNKAFTQSPEGPGVKTLLAYAFLLNQQKDMAEQYLQNAAEDDVVAMLVRAGLDIQSDQKPRAAESLKKVLGMAVPPAVRNKADELLKQCAVEIVEDTSGELIRKDLTDKFGKTIIPAFIAPDKQFSARLNFNGTEFAYSNAIEGEVVIANTGSTPLIIGREGLLTGRYQVDVVVGGDMKVKIPGLLEGAFRPARPILPGESVSIRLDLNTGELERILFTYPQASLEMKFIIYLNPAQADDGTIGSGIKGIDPIEATIRRKGVVLTREFLIKHLDALTKGQEGLKIRTAEMFAGLYAEQQAYRAGTVTYRHSQTESTLLNDAVRRSILDDNWKVRVHTLVLLSRHSIGLDYSMTLSVSENINHESWPVRMAAMWLLASQQKTSFQSVLDWSCQNDPFWLNRQLAVALGGSEKKVEPVPAVSEPQKP